MPITRAYTKAGSPLQGLANPVINGGFDIWQRGTSFSASSTYSSSFLADRWNMFVGTTTGYTLSRQTVSDSTNLPNIQYALRTQRASGTTGSNSATIGQSIEIVNSIPFAGKAITLSFYARKGADYSGASSIMNASLKTGTGTTDANGVYNNYTGQSVVINNQQFTLTTSWQRFVATGTIGSTATQIALEFVGSHSGTSGTNDYWEVTGVQIDIGTYTAATAPEFRRSGGTLAGELSACQRYYEVGSLWREGTNANTSSYCVFSNSFLVQKRANATMTFGNVADANANISSIDGPEAIYSSISPFSKNNLQTGFAFRFIPSATTSTIRQYWTASAEL